MYWPNNIEVYRQILRYLRRMYNKIYPHDVSRNRIAKSICHFSKCSILDASEISFGRFLVLGAAGS